MGHHLHQLPPPQGGGRGLCRWIAIWKTSSKRKLQKVIDSPPSKAHLDESLKIFVRHCNASLLDVQKERQNLLKLVKAVQTCIIIYIINGFVFNCMKQSSVMTFYCTLTMYLVQWIKLCSHRYLTTFSIMLANADDTKFQFQKDVETRSVPCSKLVYVRLSCWYQQNDGRNVWEARQISWWSVIWCEQHKINDFSKY